MPRYGDFDALKEKADELPIFYTYGESSSRLIMYESLIDAIDNAPTADVENVVRCKECWKRHNANKCPMCFAQCIVLDDDCFDPDYKYVMHDNTTDDGFCSCGERETNG